jgi:hypothetical protein
MTTSFALRMPPEVKEAAKALSQRGVYIAHPDNTYSAFDSINGALCFLLDVGARGVRDMLKANLADATKEHTNWTGIMRFFLDNPSAATALPFNFPEGSIERKEIENLIELQPEDFAGGFDRPWFTDEFATRQRTVWQLTEVLGVVQKAIGPRP